ncbi:MAG: Mrp/NBP35 family ATP-binding protein [Rikenellaceae bacterium]|jgi:ATP-binding protein involved in chromosome partitioning|nr:Mrp/NBP35 family ATP-binding protein [Rikenellaceae bacterium]
MTEEQVRSALGGIVHPELGKDIVSLGLVGGVAITDATIRVTLELRRANDPFAVSLKRAVEAVLADAFPDYVGKIAIYVREAAPKKVERPEMKTATGGVRNIIAVASGKGGVGKSTVAANLAVALARSGRRVGILDADIYGPSMPKMFGLEGFLPPAEPEDGRELIVPAEKYGVKVMSIGFFIKPTDALVWRGAMATNALRQLIHQTGWGELDFLLIDMPPGTGDVHLTLVQELAVTGAVIVSTPQQVALADVVRGIRMFRSDGINVPVLGLVENMAWFTPAELPENKYYIFGKEGCKRLAGETDIPLLGQIPLVQSVCEGSDSGVPIAEGDSVTGRTFSELAARLTEAVEKRNADLDPTRRVQAK